MSFAPCWVQTPLARVNTQAAPVRSVVAGGADQGGVAFFAPGERHAVAEVARFFRLFSAFGRDLSGPAGSTRRSCA